MVWVLVINILKLFSFVSIENFHSTPQLEAVGPIIIIRNNNKKNYKKIDGKEVQRYWTPQFSWLYFFVLVIWNSIFYKFLDISNYTKVRYYNGRGYVSILFLLVQFQMIKNFDL